MYSAFKKDKSEFGETRVMLYKATKLFHRADNLGFIFLSWIIDVISVLFLSCFRARLFIDALWSPAGKGLTSWLSSVMSNCEVVTFLLVSWVRCVA